MGKRSLIWYKSNGLIRNSLVRNFGLLNSQLVVNEYPKCGATWLSQMIEDATGIEYPRLKFPGFRPNILHGHYLNTTGITRGILMWRDPRDILVSHFFHCVYYKNLTSDSNTRKVRMLIGLKDNESVDFERDFEIYFNLLQMRKIHPFFTIRDFYNNWFEKKGHIHTSYERLQRDAENELYRIIVSATTSRPSLENIRNSIRKFDFETISGRQKGKEKSKHYLRKGIVGDWENYIKGSNLELVTKTVGKEIDLFTTSILR